ncbi:MAG: DinB family protein [Thermoanaerobaculia bacterium]|nr:DinB family protein [Thermoanaerobaculia bacterium]
MSSIDQSRAVLSQGIQLLDVLPEGLYGASDSEGGSGMGPHLRHCIEFYRCFLSGLGEGRVDYDGRQRERALELDPVRARAALASIERELAAVAEGLVLERSLIVRSDAETPAPESWCPSSVGRELSFLLSHTVHHYALIAQILRRHGHEPDPNFGLAPSTLRFREQTGATCAP